MVKRVSEAIIAVAVEEAVRRFLPPLLPYVWLAILCGLTWELLTLPRPKSWIVKMNERLVVKRGVFVSTTLAILLLVPMALLYWWGIQKAFVVLSQPTSEERAAAELLARQKRTEFLQRRGDPLRGIVFFVRLDRKYTPEELGHFHLAMEAISRDTQGSSLIVASQDSYATWQHGAASRLMFGTLHDAWIVDPDQDLQHTIIGGSAFDRDDFSSSWVDASASIEHRGPFQTIGAFDHAVLLFYASRSILPKLAYMGVSAGDYLILGLPVGQLDTAPGKPSIWPKSLSEPQKADLQGVDWVQLVRKPYNPLGPSPPFTAIVPDFDRYTPVRLGELYQQKDWSSIVVPAN
jgi:hypothetical protein